MASLKKIGIAMLFAGSLQAILITSGGVEQDPVYFFGPTEGSYRLFLDDGYSITGNPFIISTSAPCSSRSCSLSVASFTADLNSGGPDNAGRDGGFLYFTSPDSPYIVNASNPVPFGSFLRPQATCEATPSSEGFAHHAYAAGPPPRYLGFFVYRRALAGMLAVFAEFEREILWERVKAGVAQARAKGTTFGRPRSATRKTAEIKRLYRKEKQIQQDPFPVVAFISHPIRFHDVSISRRGNSIPRHIAVLVDPRSVHLR
ncbi:MAG: recombinase family protein [Acidobacteriota bacterium]|nr:recombinase family protein [Acidobacteriota bacterium]